MLTPRHSRALAALAASALALACAPKAVGVPNAATPAAAAAPCSGLAAQPRDKTWTLTVGGVARTFDVHVPPSYDPTKRTPVVVNFHGYGINPRIEEWLTEMSKTADREGFVLVYPVATGSPTAFNAGACCGDPMTTNVDDVGYTRAILDAVGGALCVDTRRVYATGMSNGGFMAHRIGCELADRFAAIAPVAGPNATATCTPSRAISVLTFHGTADPEVPYEGDAAKGWPSVAATARAWALRDGCRGEAAVTFQKSDVTCATYGACTAGTEVTTCTFAGAGHTWPGGSDLPPELHEGSTSRTISANDAMWSFFVKHPMPTR